MKTYHELISLPTFRERYLYLKLDGTVGKETFGSDRYLNQVFYRSDEWKRIRNLIILRDNGCDLAVPDREITGKLFIHHMNPIDVNDIIQHSDFLLNPDYLICVSKLTHDAIHFGDESILKPEWTPRKPGDTKLW